jgi:hypothetical protein
MQFHYFPVNQQKDSMSMSGSSEQVLNPTNDHDNDSTANQNQSSLKRRNQSEGNLLFYSFHN